MNTQEYQTMSEAKVFFAESPWLFRVFFSVSSAVKHDAQEEY